MILKLGLVGFDAFIRINFGRVSLTSLDTALINKRLSNISVTCFSVPLDRGEEDFRKR